jgi:hypothetical protein
VLVHCCLGAGWGWWRRWGWVLARRAAREDGEGRLQ